MVDATCNACHPIGARTGSGYTADGWDTVMRMMLNHGVSIPQDQLPAVKAYLVKTYPVKGRAPAVLVPGPVKALLNASVKPRARTAGTGAAQGPLKWVRARVSHCFVHSLPPRLSYIIADL